jgi:ribosomal protein S18 acetylase RimI-like enzyme
MFEIRPLVELSEPDLRRTITGYVSHEKFQVSYTSTDQKTTFNLELVSLGEPYVKHFDPSEEDIHHCQEALQAGWSIGAFDGEELAAIAIAGPERWNDTLRVWEFHVAESCRGRGIGRQLMDRLAERARPAGLRAMVVETQNTNVPAIRFYWKTGFVIEGIDISYYTNQDYPDGEMAVFMKRRL